MFAELLWAVHCEYKEDGHPRSHILTALQMETWTYIPVFRRGEERSECGTRMRLEAGGAVWGQRGGPRDPGTESCK